MELADRQMEALFAETGKMAAAVRHKAFAGTPTSTVATAASPDIARLEEKLSTVPAGRSMEILFAGLGIRGAAAQLMAIVEVMMLIAVTAACPVLVLTRHITQDLRAMYTLIQVSGQVQTRSSTASPLVCIYYRH